MEVRGEKNDLQFDLYFAGRIDSTNAPECESQVQQLVKDAGALPVVIHADDLEYISSAGLRVLLHLKKTNPKLKIDGCCPEVYEILDMTGFTQMIEVEKAYRHVNVEGCEIIGQGANGAVYRIDSDTVVKVYLNADALEDIRHEREVARLALILGIPTAISYDVVKVGDSYASMFELLNARSFNKIMVQEPDKMEWCIDEYVKMLARIHSTRVPAGKLPDMKETVLKWTAFLKDHLPEASYYKLLSMVHAVPEDDHMIHGDYHTKNIMLQGDEVLLIDMDTLAMGHPIFELAFMYNAFIGFSEYNPDNIIAFQGFDQETAVRFWHKVLQKYLGTEDEKIIRDVEEKAAIIGYTRLIRRSLRRGGLEDAEKKAEIELWRSRLIELLDRHEDLDFLRYEALFEADTAKLPDVLAFVDAHLEKAGCGGKVKNQIDVCVEEIFVNVASYAFNSGEGTCLVHVDIPEDLSEASITFRDNGMPFDPLKREDPDVSLPASERNIGGLGLFIVKKTMDAVDYKYADGMNILRITKKLV